MKKKLKKFKEKLKVSNVEAAKIFWGLGTGLWLVIGLKQREGAQ